MQKLIEVFLNMLGVRVENAGDQTHCISNCTLGEIFNRDVARHDRDHEIAMRSGPIIPDNKKSLGYCDG
jgi:hypothetical protein